MLIIKIKQEENINKKKEKRRKREKHNNKSIERSNIKIDNEIHTVLSLSESEFHSAEFERLLKVYKGKVVAPMDDVLCEVVEDYIFDTKPYFKRAVLSAFLKNSEDDLLRGRTVCVVDSDFQITQEYAELAKFARKLVIISEKNITTQKFTDYCFLNFGAVVSFKNEINHMDYDIWFELDNIFDDGRIIIKYKDRDAVLHPDPDYFLCNKSVSDVISLGIPIKTACAAFEVKLNEEINWQFKANNPNIRFNFT